MKSPKSLQVQITDKSIDSFWSWIACISSFSLQFLVGGLHCSFGIFFVALLDKFGRSEAETAWVGALTIGLTFFCGPLSTHLCNRFGCRIVACTGSVLLAVSMFLTSISNSIMCMYFTYGVLGGLACSMLYFSSLVALIQYFHKHLSLANGIAVSGVGAGTLVISTLSQYLISKFGLPLTFRVIAAFSAVAFIAGLAYSPLRTPGEEENSSNLQKERITAKKSISLASKCKAFCKPGKQWQNKGFLVWVMAMSLILFAYYIPSMYLSKIAKDIGVPSSEASLLIGFMYISQSAGKLAVGKIADLRSANRPLIFQLSLLVIAVAGCLLPLAKSYTALVTYTIVQGFFDGSFVVLSGLITYDIVGQELMTEAAGSLNSVIAIPMTLGPPVAGMFYDFLGNYNVVFFVSSGLVCAGICITFVVPWLTPPNLSKFANDRQVLLSIENDIDKCHEDEKHYDMSYVDESKLAHLISQKNGINRLMERNRSFLDFGSVSRPSSFILFNIVSDEHPHDISAYTSRQELAFISGTTTPLRGTPGTTRRRYNDVQSHTSMYSLRQSFVDVTETQGNTDCAEHTAVTLVPLETVEEVNEGERKIPRQEKQFELFTENEEAKEIASDIENLAAQGEERGSSSFLSDSDESWKSSSQSTADTIDSGYVEYADTSSSKDKLSTTFVWGDKNTRHSADNVIDHSKTELPKSCVCSFSCTNVTTELPELSYIVTNPNNAWEVSSVESIDKHSYVHSIDKHSYVESIDKQSYVESIDKQSYVESIDKHSYVESIDKDSCMDSVDNHSDCYDYNDELLTYSESPHKHKEESRCQAETLCWSTKEKDGNSSEVMKVVNQNAEKSIEGSEDEEDMFSSLAEDILEHEVGGTEYLKSYQRNYSLDNGYLLYGGNYRETVV